MKKVLVGLTALAAIAASAVVLAAETAGVGKLATTVTNQLAPIATLITAGSYVAGIALVVAAIVKFKAHKENPTQIPISTPIALIFVGAALIFSPSIFKAAGGSIFSGGGESALASGVSDFGATKAKGGG